MATQEVAGEQLGRESDEELFKRDEAGGDAFARRGQAHEALKLLRDGQESVHRPPVGLVLQLDRHHEAAVGDEGEGMGRIDGNGGDDGQDLVKEAFVHPGLVVLGEIARVRR